MSIQDLLSDHLISRCDYTPGGNPEYLADAAPGSGMDEMEWRIRKFIYDGSGKWIATLFASGNTQFNKVWNDRSTYTYL